MINVVQAEDAWLLIGSPDIGEALKTLDAIIPIYGELVNLSCQLSNLLLNRKFVVFETARSALPRESISMSVPA